MDLLKICPLTVCHLHQQTFIGAFLQEKDEKQCTVRKADIMLEVLQALCTKQQLKIMAQYFATS